MLVSACVFATLFFHAQGRAYHHEVRQSVSRSSPLPSNENDAATTLVANNRLSMTGAGAKSEEIEPDGTKNVKIKTTNQKDPRVSGWRAFLNAANDEGTLRDMMLGDNRQLAWLQNVDQEYKIRRPTWSHKPPTEENPALQSMLDELLDIQQEFAEKNKPAKYDKRPMMPTD